MNDENKNLDKIDSKTKHTNVIIAPHPDDEIIGCYEVLMKEKVVIIYDTTIPQVRREEALKLKDYVDIEVQLFLQTIPNTFINPFTTIYVPDPFFEIHPSHRRWGVIGESIARSGFDVVFYTTAMNTPYIYETKDYEKKEELLNNVYPSQKDLWAYEKKYVIFEGRNKWIFPKS